MLGKLQWVEPDKDLSTPKCCQNTSILKNEIFTEVITSVSQKVNWKAAFFSFFSFFSHRHCNSKAISRILTNRNSKFIKMF